MGTFAEYWALSMPEIYYEEADRVLQEVDAHLSAGGIGDWDDMEDLGTAAAILIYVYEDMGWNQLEPDTRMDTKSAQLLADFISEMGDYSDFWDAVSENGAEDDFFEWHFAGQIWAKYAVEAYLENNVPSEKAHEMVQERYENIAFAAQDYVKRVLVPLKKFVDYMENIYE